jgi:hypothetical protein
MNAASGSKIGTGNSEEMSSRLSDKSTRLLSVISVLVVLSSIIWGAIGLLQVLVGFAAQIGSVIIGGFLELPGDWATVIGPMNLFGVVQMLWQLRHVRRSERQSYKKLRDSARGSTVLLGVQAIGWFVADEAVTGFIMVSLTGLEGVIWYLSQLFMSQIEARICGRELSTIEDIEKGFLAFLTLRGRKHRKETLLENIWAHKIPEGHIVFASEVTTHLVEGLAQRGVFSLPTYVIGWEGTDGQLNTAAKSTKVSLYVVDRQLKSTGYGGLGLFEAFMKNYGIQFQVYRRLNDATISSS